MDANQERERGIQAERILKDELFQEAWDGLHKRCMDAWRQTKPGQVEERERMFVEIRILDALKNTFLTHVQTGKFAAQKIEQERKRKPNAQ